MTPRYTDIKRAKEKGLLMLAVMDSSSHTHVARRYSINELLRMQKSLSVVICAIKQINKHLDIAGLFHLPDEAFRHPNRFSCETQKLADITNKSKPPQLSKRQMGQSSEDSEHYTKSESNTNREHRQIQWSLRRRESSDRSSQPHSAPSGLVAQQSENFQRFYRAVVSPTHVRVTAGGRIVPNTRFAAPPVYEWNGDRLHFETKHPSQEELNTLQASPWPHNTPLPAGFPSLVPTGFSPLYGFLPQGNNSLGLQVMGHQASSSFSATEHKSFEGEQISKINGEPGASSQQIKISPPTQFDQTKPFMYNGHVVYPVPQGFQPPPNALPVPVTMLGNPNFLQGPPQSPVGFFPSQFPIPMASMPHPLMLPQGQRFPMLLQNADQGPEILAPVTPQMPRPEMMPVSELTRSQLHGLRHHLKFIDNSLANNKNQVDTFYMMSQRAAVQDQINTMEGILKLQLGKDIDGPPVNRRDGNNESDQQKSSSSSENNKVILSPLKAEPLPIVTPSEQMQNPQKLELEGVQVALKHAETNVRAPSQSKSRLSAAAAMAPPFQPRAPATISQTNNFAGFSHTPPTEPALYRAQARAQLENRPSEMATANWGDESQTPKAVAHASLSRAHTLHETSMQGVETVQPSTFHRSNTFHGQTAPLAALSTPPFISPQTVPYLVGILPAGVTASDATPQDLIYSRPLTDEEIRARYLYWGKAPRHIQSGLPKFDGKDFYPPSPMKENARLATTNQDATNRLTSRLSLPDFENLFTEIGAPGYKTPSPVRPVVSLQSTVEDSTQPFVQNGTGYRAFPRQIFTSNNNASGHANWSNQYANTGQATYQPVTPPSATTNFNNAGEEDYSSLFMERGVPGYKSPTPPRPAIQQETTILGNEIVEMPVTPKNINATEYAEYNRGLLIPSTGDNQWVSGKGDVTSPSGNEAQSDTSTVEIHLTPQKKGSPKRPDIDEDAPFAERVANFNTEQQTLFLQNILKNTATMSGPALSGGVSSATAQGYLPQYRGSAAASLSPAMLNISGFEHGIDHSTIKPVQSQDINVNIVQIDAGKILLENRPLSRAIPIVRPAPEIMDAQSYMRYLQQKAEDDKKAHGWNPNTTGTGPVMGSDW